VRTRQRTAKTFYYRLYTGETEIIDDYGNPTGQYVKTYSDPIAFKANISPPSGEDVVEIFGALERYDRVIQTCDMSCAVDETSVLYIDTAPVQSADGAWSAHDYIVSRVAPSVNTIRIGCAKVNVSNKGQGVISA
jgi:hypothetical protein